jgi:tRNA threonylcarbamoyladenosine biosynthesis protein TsaB
LRIAAATAKGLVAGLRLQFLAYSGLLAVAAGTGLRSRPVCALFDARRDQVYAACYRLGDQLETLLEPQAESIDQVLTRLNAADVVFAGEGALRHAQRIVDRGGQLWPHELGTPRASMLLWLARAWPHLGQVTNVQSWEPDYLRASGAERGRHG